MPEESSGGPYLSTAVICEKLLEEKTGVLSIIRIIDRIQVDGSAEEMPPIAVPLTVLVSLKAGMLRGKFKVKITPVSPTGQQMGAGELPALFEGEDRGVNLIFNMNFVAREEGLYWIDVHLQDTLVTRIPLRFLYRRVSTGVSQNL